MTARPAVALLLAVCLAGCVSAQASSDDARLAEVKTWSFAIGEGTLRGDYLRRLEPFDLVVVDGVEARSAQVRALRARGKIVLAYLSVGTIERYRSWYRAAKPYRLDLWGDWGEWYADVSRGGFRRLITRRVAPRILRKGFDGLFLDNVAMIEDHRRQARGMRTLVAALSRMVHRRDGYLFAQNGEAVTRPMFKHLDGWNREDVTRTYSFRRKRYVAVPRGEREDALAELRRVAARGLLTTATDYVTPGDAAARDAAVTAACSVGALPYVSDIGLRRVPFPARRC